MQFNFAKPALGVVYNTTMSRPDAALALAMLYGFEGRKEARVGALALTHASLGAAKFCDIVNRFYNGTSPFINSNRVLPVGLDADAILPADSPMVMATLDRAQYSCSVAKVSDTSEIRALMRNALTAQNDGNAVSVLSAPAGRLLQTLELATVRELVTAKVRMLVISGDVPDVPAARQLLAAWPAPVVLCGKEVGDALPFPGASMDKEFAWSPAHPVVDAYRAARPMPYDAPSQDLAAVFHAVHPDAGLFKISDPGTIEFAGDGRSTFTPTPGGKHRQLIVDPDKKEKIIQTFVEIASAKPVPRTQFRRQAQDADQDKKSAAGGSVDGVWKADYTTPDGTARTSTFYLKGQGEKLTGKMVSPMGEAEIKDGAINAGGISFSVTRNFNGNEFTLKYAGKVAGDELKLQVSFNENTFDIVAKRQGS